MAINHDPKMTELRRQWQQEDPAGKDTLHSMEQGIVEVENWARARGIIPNSNSTAQLLKAVSEMGELADDHNKGKAAGKVDGVGDVLVCLINYCALEDISMLECLDRAWKSIRGRKGHMNAQGVFIKEAESPEEQRRQAQAKFVEACKGIGLDPDKVVLMTAPSIDLQRAAIETSGNVIIGGTGELDADVARTPAAEAWVAGGGEVVRVGTTAGIGGRTFAEMKHGMGQQGSSLKPTSFEPGLPAESQQG